MNSSRRIAVAALLSCAFAGFPGGAAAAEPFSPLSHWYVGTGLGPAFGAKFKLNGQWISFDDQLQGTTDKSPLLGLNIVNAGVALSPNLLFGFSGSAAAQTATLAGSDVGVQINNYFAALTYFPAEKGFFVRGGGGLSIILVDTGAGDGDRSSGVGILLGAGYALPVAGRHNVTFTLDYSRQFYKRSDTRAEDSQFAAAYLGYMYRR